MDCTHRIPPSGTPAHHHRSQYQHRHHHRSTSCHHHEDRYRCSSPGHNLIIKDTTAKTAMTPREAILGPTIGTTNDNTGVIHDAHTQAHIHIILTMTLHTADHLHTGAHQLTKRSQQITLSISLQAS